MTINYKDKYAKQLQSIKDNYKTFDLPYNGEDNDDYVNGQGFCCNDGTPKTAQAREMAHTRAANGNFKLNDKYEKMQFYYHPDHLGSSSYITNLDGKVSQHIEYVPFGEVFIEERNNTWNTPYLFNAKEFDEETGLYYYGARYYEPRLGLWMSVDPISNYDPQNDNNYLDGEHNGSVYNSFNIYPYEYCYQNSILLVDYTGKQANSSVLLARIPSGDYNFTPAASHLLHLVSKVNEYQIRVATVRFEETGILKGSVGTAGSSLTAGKDPDHTVITHFYKNIKNNMTYKETNGKFFYEFFNRNTHEVGHIPQVNGTQHLASSLGQYLKNVISGENWHDGRYSTKEHDADKGAQEFQKFNKFIDNKTQKNGLKNLFYNKKNSQDKIIETIDKWWNLYERSNHNKGNE